MTTSGISTRFQVLSRTWGQVAYALLTRPPVYSPSENDFPPGLHVLGTPPAFVLSQDQTLRCGIFLRSNFWVIPRLSTPTHQIIFSG